MTMRTRRDRSLGSPERQDRPRLLVATVDCPPAQGGIQRIVDELARRSTAGWDVTVLAPAYPGSHGYDDSVPFRIRRTQKSWAGSHMGVLRAMATMVHHERADLLVAAHLNVLPPLVFAGRRRPLVLILYGSELWTARGHLLALTLGRRVTCGLAVSQFTAEQAAKVGIAAARISVTPPGADLQDAKVSNEILQGLGLRTGGGVAPFLLSVSRLSEPHKGHDLVIRAMPAILRRQPDARYVIVGEGCLSDDLKALARKEGVGHAVRFGGQLSEGDKAALLHACRAFVMVSREQRRPALFEGFGIVYIEAALAGRPAIAGASGGCRDAVLDGETGVLVDPTSVTDVACAALRLLQDPEYADRLGVQAQRRAQADFTWDKAIARMNLHMESALR